MHKVLVPIENTALVRDMSTSAVLNTDIGEQSRYQSLHRKRSLEIKENADTKGRLRHIEEELSQLKHVINELLVIKDGK